MVLGARPLPAIPPFSPRQPLCANRLYVLGFLLGSQVVGQLRLKVMMARGVVWGCFPPIRVQHSDLSPASPNGSSQCPQSVLMALMIEHCCASLLQTQHPCVCSQKALTRNPRCPSINCSREPSVLFFFLVGRFCTWK